MSEDDRLIYLVFTAQQRLRNYLNNAFARNDTQVTPAQAGILALLIEQDGRTMTELSRILSIDNSTITGLIDRLEKSGFVRRKAKKGDRRISLIFISKEGSDEAGKAVGHIRRVNEEIKSGFSEDEIEAFKKVLRSFFVKFTK
jgi:DNA-binding MarR family transcriptional regulator